MHKTNENICYKHCVTQDLITKHSPELKFKIKKKENNREDKVENHTYKTYSRCYKLLLSVIKESASIC